MSVTSLLFVIKRDWSGKRPRHFFASEEIDQAVELAGRYADKHQEDFLLVRVLDETPGPASEIVGKCFLIQKQLHRRKGRLESRHYYPEKKRLLALARAVHFAQETRNSYLVVQAVCEISSMAGQGHAPKTTVQKALG